EIVNVHRDLRIEDGFQRLDHRVLGGDLLAFLQRRAGIGAKLAVLRGIEKAVHALWLHHHHYSVDTFSSPSSAAFIVCQARVAHFTRIGNCRTPASTCRRSIASASSMSWAAASNSSLVHIS